MAITPKLKWPLEMTAAGRMAVVEQDSIEEIEQCVALIGNVEKGQITSVPEMGLTPRELTRNNPAQAAEIVAEIRAIEPRADLDGTLRRGRTSTERIIDLTVGRTP